MGTAPYPPFSRTSQTYSARPPFGIVSNSILNSEGFEGPEDTIGAEESGGTYYYDEFPSLEFFPYGNGYNGGESIGKLLNDQVAHAEDANAQKEFAPVDISDGGSNFLPHDLAFNMVYNVKTWRIAGNAGNLSFDEELPAGCYHIDTPYLYDKPPRPYSGKRAKFGCRGLWRKESGDDVGTIDFSVGDLASESDIVQLWRFNQPTPCILPIFYLDVTWHKDSGGSGSIKSLVDFRTAQGTKDNDLTVMGYSLFTTPLVGSADYEIHITAKEYWGTEEWYE